MLTEITDLVYIIFTVNLSDFEGKQMQIYLRDLNEDTQLIMLLMLQILLITCLERLFYQGGHLLLSELLRKI